MARVSSCLETQGSCLDLALTHGNHVGNSSQVAGLALVDLSQLKQKLKLK